MTFALARQMRQEGARRMHHAPEIDVDQPFHLRLLDLVEATTLRGNPFEVRGP